MRCGSTRKSVRVVLRFSVGLIVGLFVLGISNAQNVEASHAHKKRFHKAEPVTCGIEVHNGYYELTGHLACSGETAITIRGPAKLNLRGYTLSNDGENDCIRIIDDGGATVSNGAVMNCKDGIRIESDHNNIISVISSNNDRRGFRIDGGFFFSSLHPAQP